MLTEQELQDIRDDVIGTLPDSCRIVRVRTTDRSALNATTGEYTDTEATVYEGDCRIQPTTLQQRAEIYGERSVDLVTYQATFPHDCPALEKDDRVTVTESSDAQLVGRVLEVHSVTFTALHTARRAILEEVRDR